MTPERQKWWDSLPQEEKEIRKIIKKSKHQIHSYKQEMTTVLTDCKKNGWPISSITEKIFDSYKREMRTAKLFIKILRKSIAMRTIKEDDVRCCPKCAHVFVKDKIRGIFTVPNACPDCGQKLISVHYVLSRANDKIAYIEV